MAHNEEARGIIHCELTPEDGRTRCEMRIQGSGNALLNAHEQITTQLVKSLIEQEGKEVAMGLYASVQMRALKAAGLDPEAEAKQAAEKLMELKELKRKLSVLDGLKDILGKTFTMPEKEAE